MAVVSHRSSPSGRDTRDDLMAAAIALLDGERAFADVTVAEIVEQAGVTRPTFYAYFRDKRDLVVALGADLEAAAHTAAESWLDLDEDDLLSVLRSVLATFREHRVSARAIVEASGYDAQAAAFWRQLHDRFIAYVVDRQRRLDPDAPRTPVEARAFTLVWMTERSIFEHLHAPHVGDEELLEALEHHWRTAFPTGGPR